MWRSKDTKAEQVSIALLPLDSISGNDDNDWISDGITDALIINLAKISGLRVISRSSVMRYKYKNTSVLEIAHELSVDYEVDCSVLKEGNQVRISARLIDAPKDEYFWTEDYERAFSNILILQAEIARTIA